jgi:hypothetical protein
MTRIFKLKHKQTGKVVRVKADTVAAVLSKLKDKKFTTWQIISAKNDDGFEGKPRGIRGNVTFLLNLDATLAFVKKKNEFLQKYYKKYNSINIDFSKLDDIETVLRMRRKVIAEKDLER